MLQDTRAVCFTILSTTTVLLLSGEALLLEVMLNSMFREVPLKYCNFESCREFPRHRAWKYLDCDKKELKTFFLCNENAL